MRISKFFNSIIDYESRVYVILFVLFFVGFTYGCYFSLCGNAGDVLSVPFQSENVNLCVNIILKDVFCLLFAFMLGYTVVGFPVLCFIILFHGMYFGIAVSQYTYLFGIKGSLLSGVVFLPYVFIFTTSLILLSFSSLRMSVALYNVFKKGTRFISPKTYSIPHVIRCSVLIFINVVFSFVFSYLIYPIIDKIL